MTRQRATFVSVFVGITLAATAGALVGLFAPWRDNEEWNTTLTLLTTCTMGAAAVIGAGTDRAVAWWERNGRTVGRFFTWCAVWFVLGFVGSALTHALVEARPSAYWRIIWFGGILTWGASKRTYAWLVPSARTITVTEAEAVTDKLVAHERWKRAEALRMVRLQHRADMALLRLHHAQREARLVAEAKATIAAWQEAARRP